MDNQVLYDQKWQKFLRKAWLFRHLPFAEMVIASGSLVLGRLHTNSDFDVLVAAKKGRLFTARFFCLMIFGLLGWRRKINRPRDGFCFNHFITKETFRLSFPHTNYDFLLYNNLMPIWGEELFYDFYSANEDWIKSNANLGRSDLRMDNFQPSHIKFFLEKILSDRLGDAVEKVVRYLQTATISHSINRYGGAHSQTCYGENEVRLWFNPKGGPMLEL